MAVTEDIRVGTDLVAVDDVAASVRRFGDRYVRRVFTEHEIASCGGPGGVSPAGLAARFAAKEAVIKVLRPAAHQPDWRAIEVRRAPEGWCGLHLAGEAARQAEAAGISNWAVSLSHEAGLAAAVVVAVVGPPPQ